MICKPLCLSLKRRQSLETLEDFRRTTQERRPILGGRMNFPVCLAPMVGLSHVVLRLLVRRYLPAGAEIIWPTEMLNSKKIPFEDLTRLPEAFRHSSERGLVPQILGNEEESIRQSVFRLIDWGAEGIDINMGCPVSKALKHNYGVALMGDPTYAAEVVRVTVKHSSVPVSVKLRAGLQEDFSYLRSFVLGLFDAGAQWITLHPRVAAQKRRGSADWSQIRRLRLEVPGAVIGNGDVQTADDAIRMLEETDCDAVMVGRALAARPWLLWQVGEKLGWPAPPGLAGRAPQTPNEEGAEYGFNALHFIDLAEEYFKPDLALRKFRFWVRTTAVWLPFGQDLVSRSTKGKSLGEIRESFAEFFSRPVEMAPTTALRE